MFNAGNLAHRWSHLQADITPLASNSPMRRSIPTLTVLRKEPDGRWVIFRDANLFAAVAIIRESSLLDATKR
jgi:ketosteroid isomerase-like protein